MNLKTGYYEATENNVLYQLNFSQMNDLKIYCRVYQVGKTPTIEGWYNELTSYSRKQVKVTRPGIEETDFYPDE